VDTAQRSALDAVVCVLLAFPLAQEVLQICRAFFIPQRPVREVLESMFRMLSFPIFLFFYLSGQYSARDVRDYRRHVWSLFEEPVGYIFNFWNLLDVFTYGSTIATLALRKQDPTGYPAAIASGLAGLGAWLRLLSYFRGFEATGVLVNTILQISSDIKFVEAGGDLQVDSRSHCLSGDDDYDDRYGYDGHSPSIWP
jgi:hypothetical protein